MRSRWLLSVALCLFGTALAFAQPAKKPPISSTGEPRTAVPTDLNAPANKLNERGAFRGFADGDDNRAQLSTPTPRTLVQEGKDNRSYHAGADTKRAANEAATTRDSALLRVQPGDKVNKIADANSGDRNFAPVNTGRSALPAGQTAPDNRRITGDR